MLEGKSGCIGARMRFPFLAVKNLPANAGDLRDAESIRGSGRSPGRGRINPLH